MLDSICVRWMTIDSDLMKYNLSFELNEDIFSLMKGLKSCESLPFLLIAVFFKIGAYESLKCMLGYKIIPIDVTGTVIDLLCLYHIGHLDLSVIG